MNRKGENFYSFKYNYLEVIVGRKQPDFYKLNHLLYWPKLPNDFYFCGEM